MYKPLITFVLSKQIKQGPLKGFWQHILNVGPQCHGNQWPKGPGNRSFNLGKAAVQFWQFKRFVLAQKREESRVNIAQIYRILNTGICLVLVMRQVLRLILSSSHGKSPLGWRETPADLQQPRLWLRMCSEKLLHHVEWEWVLRRQSVITSWEFDHSSRTNLGEVYELWSWSVKINATRSGLVQNVNSS